MSIEAGEHAFKIYQHTWAKLTHGDLAHTVFVDTESLGSFYLNRMSPSSDWVESILLNIRLGLQKSEDTWWQRHHHTFIIQQFFERMKYW